MELVEGIGLATQEAGDRRQQVLVGKLPTDRLSTLLQSPFRGIYSTAPSQPEVLLSRDY